MMSALLWGTIIGFVLAIPPGPVAIIVIKKGLEDRYRQGIAVGLGAAFADIVFCSVVLITTTAIFSPIESFFAKNPLILLSFQVLIIGAIIGYGISNLRKRIVKEETPPVVEKFRQSASFFVGLGVAFANIVNPTFLPSLISLSIIVHHYSLLESSFWGHVLFSVGFGVGTFGWLYVLLILIDKYRTQMSARFVRKIYRFAGWSFVGFGVILGWKALSHTAWNEIFLLL